MTLCGAKTTEQGLLGSVQILRDPLGGRGGESPKRSQKITRGEGHQQITEDHDQRRLALF